MPSRALVRSVSMSDVVTDEKSADASQADFPAETRPAVRSAGSASSGPYVVKEIFWMPRPPRSSSFQ